MRRRLALPRMLCALLLGACTAEPVDTGVFQQIECDVEGSLACTDGYAYQLHIGRYGDAVTGLLVRYRYSGPGFNWAKSSECGCFIIDSGVTDGDDLSFQVFAPGAPGLPDEAFRSPLPECSPPPGDCTGRRFVLTGQGDQLAGDTACGAVGQTPVRFERVDGRPRTQCVVP